MGCRCKERGQAMARGGRALVRGDLRTVAASASFVGRTMAQDTARLAAQARAAAMAKLVRKP